MMGKRKGISKRTRFEVFKRDKFTCQYCGRNPPAVILEIDHVLPVSKGGDDRQSNLLTSCQDCNRGKSDVSLSVIPATLVEQIQERKAKAEQLRRYNAFLLRERDEEDLTVYELGLFWHNLYMPERDRWVFSPPFASKIRQFLKLLAPAEIMEAMEIAVYRVPPDGTDITHTWRYFCGVCWRKIKKDSPYGKDTDCQA